MDKLILWPDKKYEVVTEPKGVDGKEKKKQLVAEVGFELIQAGSQHKHLAIKLLGKANDIHGHV